MNSKQDANLASRIADLEKQVAKLQQEKAELTNIANDHSKMLRDIATGRPTADGGRRFVPNVHAIRDDLDSRRELVDTVANDMTSGRSALRIRNDTSTGQSIRVNGMGWILVPAHWTATLDVPSGNATTEIPQEAPKTWFIMANRTQDVVIAPAIPQYASW